jgi:hypothetical protein
MSANYSDRKEPPKPPMESVAGYKSGQAPRAARFGQGARNLEEIKQATEMRRRHNESLSSDRTGPRGPAIGGDAK